MAAPIDFTVKKVDPRQELQRRLEAAPLEHAESILEAFDFLEAAHQKGLLGLAKGVVSSKDAVFAKLAEYAKQPESVNAIRNLLIVAKLLGDIDPDTWNCISTSISRPDEQPPSLWTTFKRLRSADAKRGLSTMVGLLTALGSSKTK